MLAACSLAIIIFLLFGNIIAPEAVVVPSKSIPQGIAALFNYDEADSLSDNKARMNETLSVVSSGAITYAVRDTKIDGIEIKKDEFMGLIEDKIVILIVYLHYSTENKYG